MRSRKASGPDHRGDDDGARAENLFGRQDGKASPNQPKRQSIRDVRPIASIRVGKRHRCDLGDIDQLAASSYRDQDQAARPAAAVKGRAAIERDRIARNIAEVIDDLYRQGAPARDRSRLLDLVQVQVSHAMSLGARHLIGERDGFIWIAKTTHRTNRGEGP